MNLRIHRTFEWKCTLPLSEIKIGGDNPLTLVTTETLEYFDEGMGTWLPVPVVDDPIPENPRDKAMREQAAALIENMDVEKLKEALRIGMEIMETKNEDDKKTSL